MDDNDKSRTFVESLARGFAGQEASSFRHKDNNDNEWFEERVTACSKVTG